MALGSWHIRVFPLRHISGKASLVLWFEATYFLSSWVFKVSLKSFGCTRGLCVHCWLALHVPLACSACPLSACPACSCCMYVVKHGMLVHPWQEGITLYPAGKAVHCKKLLTREFCWWPTPEWGLNSYTHLTKKVRNKKLHSGIQNSKHSAKNKLAFTDTSRLICRCKEKMSNVQMSRKATKPHTPVHV